MRVMQTPDGRRVQITEAGAWASDVSISHYDVEVLDEQGAVVTSHLDVRGDRALDWLIRSNGWTAPAGAQ